MTAWLTCGQVTVTLGIARVEGWDGTDGALETDGRRIGGWRSSGGPGHHVVVRGPASVGTGPDDGLVRRGVCDADCMKLQHAAYWVSLADREPLSESQGTSAKVTVRVPRRNLLTPWSLRALVAGNQHGELP